MRLDADANPTLLSLLQAGAKITLSDGRYLAGEVDAGYIRLGGEFGWVGRYNLDRDGLRRALSDRDFKDLARDGKEDDR